MASIYIGTLEAVKAGFHRKDLPGSVGVLEVLQIVTGLVILIFCYTVFTKLFFRIRRLAKRYRHNARGKLTKDSRNPVLYLRSFTEEAKENITRRNLRTDEEDLAFALAAIGPVVAIGRPGDDMSPLGATRIYLRDEAWQENVERLLTISQLIVIQAGTSPGLRWEIETVMREISPSRLLISFLPWQNLDADVRDFRYEQFRLQVEDIFKTLNSGFTPKLPPKLMNTTFMVLTDDWECESIDITKWKRRLYRFSTSLLINETLRPVLKARNLKLKRWKRNAYLLYLLWIVSGFFVLVGDFVFIIVAVGVYSPLPEGPLRSTLQAASFAIYLILSLSSLLSITILMNWLGSRLLIVSFYFLKGKLLPKNNKRSESSKGHRP